MGFIHTFTETTYVKPTTLWRHYFILKVFSLFWHAEIRNQLVEQFRCLEQQSESRLQLLQDLQEFFRRKAELQLEYSRGLDKLAERYSSKIRTSREHQHFKWVSPLSVCLALECLCRMCLTDK